MSTAPTSSGDPDTTPATRCDTATHTYRWTYVPTRTGRVKFAAWDPTTLADNSGALTDPRHRARPRATR